MKYINLKERNNFELPFYLAMEEYVARYMDEDDAFFMWQVEPTVIFGRNQLVENEVNLNFCREHGIHTFRRKSGGGCVFSDKDNIMFSYITKDENVRLTFDKYENMIVDVLHRLGINAMTSGRNDILIDDKKVSGSAFYHIPGKSIVHSTMLYDIDIEVMMQAITPAHDKLKSNGVESVRQRVTTLNKYLDISIGEFKNFVRKNLCDSEITIDDRAIEVIRQIESEYLTDAFIFGKNPTCSIVKKRYFDGVGSVEVCIDLKNNCIRQINLIGDYFLVGDIDGCLLHRLIGVEYTREHVTNAINDVDVSDIIIGLNTKQFINLLFES